MGETYLVCVVVAGEDDRVGVTMDNHGFLVFLLAEVAEVVDLGRCLLRGQLGVLLRCRLGAETRS